VAEEVVIDIKQKENKFRKYAPWIAGAVLITSVLFAAGFALGKYTEIELPFSRGEVATKSATRAGWYVYETSNFSLEYPKDWEVKNNPEGESIGAKVETDGGRVEFWFESEREYRFSDKQKEQQKNTKESTLDVDERTATSIEYIYKEGDRFVVIQAPEAADKSKVIFWINASNKEYKDLLVEIVTTFRSKKIIEESKASL
jgi:hypothetical protein